jgi:hypothetical protein
MIVICFNESEDTRIFRVQGHSLMGGLTLIEGEKLASFLKVFLGQLCCKEFINLYENTTCQD